MLGELISAGANLIGGFFNRQSQNEYNKQQMQIAQQNMALQREFAQSGIQWKVQDAKAAGLHPLAALGAQTSSFSPVSVGGSAPQLDLGSFGQDIGRAVKAAMSANDRAAQDEATARRLSLEKAGLENDILRTELASKMARTSRASGQIGPGFPANTSVIPIPREGPRRQSGFAVEDDPMRVKEASGPGAHKMPLWGVIPMSTYPNRASGQDLENEYGEFGGSALALPNVLVDAAYTGYKYWLPYHQKLQRRYPRWFKD